MSGAGIVLKVTPEELEVLANRGETCINGMKKRLNRIDSTINRCHSYWEGEGKDAYIRAYNAKKADIDLCLVNFQKDIEKLRVIAGLYRGTENAVKEVAVSLPTNIIV